MKNGSLLLAAGLLSAAGALLEAYLTVGLPLRPTNVWELKS